MRTLESEFPEWDGENPMPSLIPFTFEPWRNEACPGYRWQDTTDTELSEAYLQVLVDYVDPAKRECAGPRISLLVIHDDDYIVPVSGDTWDEIRRECNAWYLKNVGYRPDDEGGGPLPMGQLLFDVGAMAYLHWKG